MRFPCKAPALIEPLIVCFFSIILFSSFSWHKLSCVILSQVLGLEWVQENISKFGGDPAKVSQTLFFPYMLIHLTHKSQTSQRLTAPIFLPTNISEKLKSIQGPVIFIFFIFSISHHFKRFNSHTFFMRTRGKSIYRRYFRWTKFLNHICTFCSQVTYLCPRSPWFCPN